VAPTLFKTFATFASAGETVMGCADGGQGLFRWNEVGAGASFVHTSAPALQYPTISHSAWALLVRCGPRLSFMYIICGDCSLTPPYLPPPMSPEETTLPVSETIYAQSPTSVTAHGTPEAASPTTLGNASPLLTDAGYFSEANVATRGWGWRAALILGGGGRGRVDRSSPGASPAVLRDLPRRSSPRYMVAPRESADNRPGAGAPTQPAPRL
jgi:hypothetical protein